MQWTDFRFGLSVFSVMFIPSLENLATEEQQQKWLPKALNLEMIGTYAQTEMAHGSNVRDLETTAHFVESTDEFIISTPSLSSIKWWPGSLGHIANVALVHAQLIIQGHCYGLHLFLVPVRDLKTHEFLPGVEVGALPENSAHKVPDSGYLSLRNVRIPRTNMLMKYVWVDRDGTYHRSGQERSSYMAMLFTRILVASDSVYALTKTLYVAIRYNLLRRQGRLEKNSRDEVLLLDYRTQQHKLLPGLALSYCANASISVIGDVVRNADLETPALGECHALTCTIKAHASEWLARASDQSRRSCGGNGLLLGSQVAEVSLVQQLAVIIEGDSTVMYLQVARYLLKVISGGSSHRSIWFDFLGEPINSTMRPRFPLHMTDIIPYFQQRSRGLVHLARDCMLESVGKGLSQGEAWNKHSQLLVRCAQAFSDLVFLTCFHQRIVQSARTYPKEEEELLWNLFELTALTVALAHVDSLLQLDLISGSDIRECHCRVENLLNAIRPRALDLVNGFGLPPDSVQSFLVGSSIDDVYEQLLAAAKAHPLNKIKINPREIIARI